MATISMLPGIKDFIKQKIIVEMKSYESVSNELKSLNPNTKGLSVRSVRRYCEENDIHGTSRLTDTQLDCIVGESVSQVGPTYGRKLMTGFLSSQGFRCSQKRVGESLKRVRPGYHSTRQVGAHRQLNPTPYHAEYFGEKLHIDQNEKLVMFGLTHVCAVDGFSGKIVGHTILPIKNNILIYNHLYKEVVTKFGLWDQIRVDCGREWYLTLYINETVAHLRNDTNKVSYRQTSSTKNHTIERLWVEVNSRINYPIKSVLQSMLESGEISLDNELHKHCISWFIIQVANEGIKLFISSWNQHTIPGRRRGLMPRGIPDMLMLTNDRTRRIDITLLPDGEDAAELYRQSGGQLRDPGLFGIDPIGQNLEMLLIRESSFFEKINSFSAIFYELVNGDPSKFRNGVLYYIDITRRLSAL